MNPLILIAEDDADIRGLLKLYLEGEGFRVLEADNGARALDLARAQAPDMAILDIMMPQLNGFELTRALRKFSDIPILILSAKSQDNDKILGLNLGADDYITKPFLPQELLLRLRAVLRRVYREEVCLARLGEAEIDWGKGTVRRGGQETALTAKEFALLRKLWEARGNIVTIDTLCSALWDGPLVGYENTLMVHIRRLREKVEADPSHPQFLLTVRGLGYRLRQEGTT